MKTTKMENASRGPGRCARVMSAAILAVALAGCEVTNPGPVQDEFLNLPDAHQALVNGAAAALSGAFGYVAVTGGFAAREIFPTGNCCSRPHHDPIEMAGRFLPNGRSDWWNRAQLARFIGEDAIRRFNDEVGPAKVAPGILTEAYLWSGYANRLLGENMCEAVFDGGPAEANVKYFERAQAQFTKAIELGTGNAKTAAYAGRASVRVFLKNWTGAVSDAQQVPAAFVYLLAADPNDEITRNAIHFSNSNAPYRGYSSFKTWFLDYYNESGDPRVQIGTNPSIAFGNATLVGYGAVPWSFQLKYTANDQSYRISTGREMVLIRAEALLTQGDWAGAMTLINSLRTNQISRKTGQPLVPWTATSLTEAWTMLKRERSIELWLEGHRMGDLRRWEENKTPGALDWPNWEAVSSLFAENPPSKCFPINNSERDTNPNL